MLVLNLWFLVYSILFLAVYHGNGVSTWSCFLDFKVEKPHFVNYRERTTVSLITFTFQSNLYLTVFLYTICTPHDVTKDSEHVGTRITPNAMLCWPAFQPGLEHSLDSQVGQFSVNCS